MSFLNKYPYTDYSELNLDWFLEEFKKVTDKVTDLDTTVQQFTEFVTNYFDNLDVQQEINRKLDQMAANGTLQALIEPYFYSVRAELLDIVDDQNAEIDVLTSRMDEFASLPPGSTSGNAELLDIRVEYDGTTAASAGDAVREQYAKVKDEADQIATKGRVDYDFQSWLEQGGIGAIGQNSNTGDSHFLRTINFLNTTDPEIANAIFFGTVGGGSGAVLYAVYYDSTQTFVRRDSAGAGYTVDTSQDLVRFSFYDPSAATYSLIKNWVAFPEFYGLYDEIVKISENAKDIEDIQDYQKTFNDLIATLEAGGINASGIEITGANYKRSATFHNTTDKLDFLYTSGTTDGAYVCYYDNTQTFVDRVQAYSGYALNTAYPYYRLTFYRSGGLTNAYINAWVHWVKNDNLYQAIRSTTDNSIVVTPGTSSITIDAKYASYSIDRITSVPNNIDTWRLYTGKLTKNGANFTMWSNSDAEGAIKINGEPDFVSGYHGDEQMVSASFYADGEPVDLNDNTPLTVSNFTMYVKSEVYHNRNSQDAGVVAFTRYKKLVFSGTKVTISNCYIPVSAMVIARAALALFQCNIQSGGVDRFTNYSVNTDYKDYSVALIGSDKPAGSSAMTEATLNTEYANIIFKHLSGTEQYYQGNVVDMTTRVKFYFDEIVTNTAVSANEKIMSEFSFDIA